MPKNLYITTAIPYVNGKPHIGNAIDYLLADIWSRYHKQNGQVVRFQVGTDEHGNKVAAKAAEVGLNPQAYADSMYGNFEKLMQAMKVDYTDFIRTTDPAHMQRVQVIWQKLQPYIYKGTYEGWYCVGCEAFVTDKEAAANGGTCPDHNAPYQRLSEENYYFKLSAFGPAIKEAIEARKLKIMPAFRQREVIKLIDGGLNDVSFSRPVKNLSWGVPVPGDDSQVMYVWCDALTNYITVLGYPDDPAYAEYWPADVQIIGKDILRFHAAIWPAMLIALDLPLPKLLLTHGHVTVGGAKMSKSVGNVIDPFDIVNGYGVDAFRYYFARHIPTMDDGDFTWEKFENAYNGELANDLGNLVSRVANMLTRYQSGVIGDVSEFSHDTQPYYDAMNDLRFDVAIEKIWSIVQNLNRYLEMVKPWEIAKKVDKDPDAEAHLAEVLGYAAGGLQLVAKLLYPFTPDLACRIKTTFDNGIVTPLDGVLFPKIYNHTPDPRNAGAAPTPNAAS